MSDGLVRALARLADSRDADVAELATKYRRAMIRLGATDADFIACGVEPPTQEERETVDE
jgi:hypothetical protein